MHLFHFETGKRIHQRRTVADPAYQRRGVGAHRGPSLPTWFWCVEWLPAASLLASSFLAWSGRVLAAWVLTIAGVAVGAWVFARLVQARR